MASGDAITIIGTMATNIGAVLTSGLGTVLGIVAVLIGLFFIVRLITKKIGSGK